MTPGICKKCDAQIIWVQDARGRWLRPLEMLELALPDNAAMRLNSAPLYRLQDGDLVQLKVSSLLVAHVCAPSDEEMNKALREVEREIQEEVQVETIMAGSPPEDADAIEDAFSFERAEREERQRRATQVVIDAQKLAREQVAEYKAQEKQRIKIDQRIAKGLKRHGDFIQSYCPRCHAVPGSLCMNTGAAYQDGKRAEDPLRYNTAPHNERVDYAWGQGLVEMTEDDLLGYAPDNRFRVVATKESARDHQILGYWLESNRELWIKKRSTDSLEPVE